MTSPITSTRNGWKYLRRLAKESEGIDVLADARRAFAWEITPPDNVTSKHMAMLWVKACKAIINKVMAEDDPALSSVLLDLLIKEGTRVLAHDPNIKSSLNSRKVKAAVDENKKLIEVLNQLNQLPLLLSRAQIETTISLAARIICDPEVKIETREALLIHVLDKIKSDHNKGIEADKKKDADKSRDRKEKFLLKSLGFYKEGEPLETELIEVILHEEGLCDRHDVAIVSNGLTTPEDTRDLLAARLSKEIEGSPAVSELGAVAALITGPNGGRARRLIQEIARTTDGSLSR